MPALFFFLGLLIGVTQAHPAESLFEKTVRENGGVIPFPYEKLAAYLSKKQAGGGSFFTATSVLIPFSRSLQQKQATLKHPRIVGVFPIARLESEANDGTKTVFVAYSEQAGQLEVISWNASANEGKGRLEFQLVTDYQTGKKPKITTPERASCILCHQGEGPIFPSAPWFETNHQSTIMLEGNSFGTMSKVPDLLSEKHAPEKSYHGVPLKGGSDLFTGAAAIDREVSFANLSLQTKKVCSGVCGQDLECKALLVASSIQKVPSPYLPPHLFKSEEEYAEKTAMRDSLLKVLKKHWPLDGYAIPSYRLPDRDPSAEEPYGMTISEAASRRDITFEPEAASVVISSNMKIAKLERSRSSLLNPKTPRPMSAAIDLENQNAIARFLDNLPHCFGFNDEDRAKIKEMGYDNTPKLLAALSSDCIKETLNCGPFDKTDLMSKLKRFSEDKCQAKDSKQEHPVQQCEKEPQAQVLPKKLLIELKKPIEALKKAPSKTDLFKTFCASCHTGAKASATILPLNDTEALAKYRSANGLSVEEWLANHSMPPKSAPEITDEQRNQMIQTLKNP